MGQFGKLAQDEARDKKKLAKKEQLERSKEELSKVSYPHDKQLKCSQLNIISGYLYFGCEGGFVLPAGGRSLG